MDQQTGKYILIVGLFIVLAGILIYFFHDYFKWFGKLPGDIKIEKGNFRFNFPFVTMIIVSIIVTIIVNIFKKYF